MIICKILIYILNDVIYTLIPEVSHFDLFHQLQRSRTSGQRSPPRPHAPLSFWNVSTKNVFYATWPSKMRVSANK